MDFLRLQKLVETFNIGLFMENRKPQLAVSVTRLQFHVAEISNFSKASS